ncbi:hypothetical protein B0H14DRAFT_3861332 [Mycena olivaceomarginata]|nr:hypothetical protein B0H14DRAFT_3861332 [Mycena olivaceomarginata]
MIFRRVTARTTATHMLCRAPFLTRAAASRTTCTATTSGTAYCSRTSTGPEHRVRDAARLPTRHTPRRMFCATATLVSLTPCRNHTLQTTRTHTVALASTATCTRCMRHSRSSPPTSPPYPLRPPRQFPVQSFPAARSPRPPCTANHDVHHQPHSQRLHRPLFVGGAVLIGCSRTPSIFAPVPPSPFDARAWAHPNTTPTPTGLRSTLSRCSTSPTSPSRRLATHRNPSISVIIDAGATPQARCSFRSRDMLSSIWVSSKPQ